MPTIHHPDLDAIPLSAIMQALGDPLRLQILRTLARGFSPCCGDLCPSASKSRLSHHLRVLREAGLLRVEADGTARRLSLRRAEVDERFPGLLNAVLASEGPD